MSKTVVYSYFDWMNVGNTTLRVIRLICYTKGMMRIDRYDYLKEKRFGMQVWNDYLNLIINSKKKIIRIPKNRA